MTLMHYLLSHVLLDDIRRFLSEGTHLARRAAPKKQLYIDFNDCRDPDRRMLAPWPASEELQAGTSTFKPFHCLRHLALIEMVDKTFTDLPLDHNTLLQELATYRAAEESQCRLLSEMQEKAVLRLVAYHQVDDNNFANARFLQACSPLPTSPSLLHSASLMTPPHSHEFHNSNTLTKWFSLLPGLLVGRTTQ